VVLNTLSQSLPSNSVSEILLSKLDSSHQQRVKKILAQLAEDGIQKKNLCLSEKGRDILEKEIESATESLNPYPTPDSSSSDPNVVIGHMGTGPYVMENLPKFISDIKYRGGQRKVVAFDMEAVAIFKARLNCSKFVVKSVCDFGDGNKDDIFHSYAAHSSAAFLLHTILDFFQH